MSEFGSRSRYVYIRRQICFSMCAYIPLSRISLIQLLGSDSFIFRDSLILKTLTTVFIARGCTKLCAGFGIRYVETSSSEKC